MRTKRARAFAIDFILLLLSFSIINHLFPDTEKINSLKASQNKVLENYTSHHIDFYKYLKDYSIQYYNLAKEQQVIKIIYLCFVLFYFVLLPFIWKGRTLGTWLNHIQIERFDKGRLHIHQLFTRNFVVIGLGYLIISTLFIYIIPSKYYFIVVSIVGLLQIVVALFSLYMIMFTKEKRGIQDLISNTEMAKII